MCGIRGKDLRTYRKVFRGPAERKAKIPHRHLVVESGAMAICGTGAFNSSASTPGNDRRKSGMRRLRHRMTTFAHGESDPVSWSRRGSRRLLFRPDQDFFVPRRAVLRTWFDVRKIFVIDRRVLPLQRQPNSRHPSCQSLLREKNKRTIVVSIRMIRLAVHQTI